MQPDIGQIIRETHPVIFLEETGKISVRQIQFVSQILQADGGTVVCPDIVVDLMQTLLIFVTLGQFRRVRGPDQKMCTDIIHDLVTNRYICEIIKLPSVTQIMSQQLLQKSAQAIICRIRISCRITHKHKIIIIQDITEQIIQDRQLHIERPIRVFQIMLLIGIDNQYILLCQNVFLPVLVNLHAFA